MKMKAFTVVMASALTIGMLTGCGEENVQSNGNTTPTSVATENISTSEDTMKDVTIAEDGVTPTPEIEEIKESEIQEENIKEDLAINPADYTTVDYCGTYYEDPQTKEGKDFFIGLYESDSRKIAVVYSDNQYYYGDYQSEEAIIEKTVDNPIFDFMIGRKYTKIIIDGHEFGFAHLDETSVVLDSDKCARPAIMYYQENGSEDSNNQIGMLEKAINADEK